MKVLHVNCLSDTLSTGQLIKELYSEGEKYGLESFVAYSKGSSVLKNSYCYSNIYERKIHALLSRITGFQGAFSYAGTKKLIAFINKVNPNVVHLHNLHDNNINFKLLLTFLSNYKAKVVITLHDCWLFTGHCCHYSAFNCCNWQTGCGNCMHKDADIPNWFFNTSKQAFSQKKKLLSSLKNLHIVGVSKWITEQAKNSFLGDISKLDTVYNWVDINIFNKSNKQSQLLAKMSSNTILLSVAARWSNAKGLDDFIALSKIIDDDKVIVLVGELGSSITLPKNIFHIPLIQDMQELSNIYNSSDIYINLSYQETFGLCAAQAMSCGLPILSYNNTANAELALNSGILVQTGDVNGVLDGINTILQSSKEYSLKAVNKAVSDFNKEKNCKKYFEIYNEGF